MTLHAPDTLHTLKELLAHQYEATLSTLNLAVAKCPDKCWHERVAKWKFRQAAFHTVFFAHALIFSAGSLAIPANSSLRFT